MTDQRHRDTAWRRRDMLALGLLSGTGALLGQAGRPAAQVKPAAPPPQPRGQVIAGFSQEATVFNPLMPAEEVDQGVWFNLFSPLWQLDPQGRFVPDLAREVPSLENGGVSADGLTWKIKLRSDVKWHDGAPFTAEDVKYTLDLINNPSFRARSRAGHSLVKDIKVVAPDEIHWRMESAYAPYLSILALTFIVPKHILDKASDPNTALNAAPVGTGPFRWGSRVTGDHLLLHASPHYHGKGPYLERVIFKYVPDLTVLYTQFRTGQIDYIGLSGITASFVEEARRLPGKKLFMSPTPFIEHIALNHEFGPFGEKAVREALYLAMNKKARIEKIYYGLPIPTESFLPQQSWAFNGDLPQHSLDAAKANALLDQAGWVRAADGIREKNGVRLEFMSSTAVGNPGRAQAQQLLMQDWREIGAALRINNMPPAVMWGEFWQKSKYQSVMVSANFTAGGDPDVTPRFGGKSIPAKGGSGSNTYQYQNPEIDRLLAQGAAEFDLASRKKTYGRIQKIIRDDLVVLPIYQVVMVEGVKDTLHGFAPNTNCSCNCWNMREWHWSA